MKRTGSKASCSRNTMESARGSSIRMATLDGNFVLKPCDPVDPTSGRAIWRQTRWCFEIWDWGGQQSYSCGQVSELQLLAGAKPLNAEDTTVCRSVTMPVNLLSLDRPDLSFAAGSLARAMKSPTTRGLEELKRVGRYLRERSVGAIVFETQQFSYSFGGALRPQTMLETWECANPALSCSHVGIAWDRGAKHHCTEQWRVRILRVARVVSSCARNQGGAD